ETHALWVIDIVTTVEKPGAALWKCKDLVKIGHRAVVEVRSTDPESSEWHVDIATGGAKVLKIPWIFVCIGVIGLRCLRSPHLGAVSIGVERAWQVCIQPDQPGV